jgi:AcrR family transcriptional regulator
MASIPQTTPASAREPGRRERKKERTRREIYGAAMRLFAESGFEGVTVEQICDDADVARATFFHHFPTKSALLYEFNRAMVAEFEAREAPAGETPGEELRALIDHLGKSWLAHGPAMSAMLREFLVTPEAVLAAEREGTALPELIEDLVRRGQESGEFKRHVTPRLATAVVLSTALAILAGGVWQPDEIEPREAHDQFLEIVLHGLESPPEN